MIIQQFLYPAPPAAYQDGKMHSAGSMQLQPAAASHGSLPQSTQPVVNGDADAITDSGAALEVQCISPGIMEKKSSACTPDISPMVNCHFSPQDDARTANEAVTENSSDNDMIVDTDNNNLSSNGKCFGVSEAASDREIGRSGGDETLIISVDETPADAEFLKEGNSDTGKSV
jgi:hypothetical protein